MFDPKPKQFPYPEYTDQHYIKTKKDLGLQFDESYPYIDRSLKFRLVSFLLRLVLYAVVFPMVKVKLGLRVEGRDNLRKHKAVIENGIVSVCNHVHMWDYLAILSAVRPHKLYTLIWAANINGENNWSLRHVGGIPVPENNDKATAAYLNALRGLLNGGGWLHIYAEGSMWEYYAPIRPFKRGAAYLACESGRPILPMAFSYREPGRIRKRIFHQPACLTLRIGEPVYQNETLKKIPQQVDLTERCHAAVCRLAGIEPEKNLYLPNFRNSRRIDYYTTEYGEEKHDHDPV